MNKDRLSVLCRVLWRIIKSLPVQVRRNAIRIAVDGTSATAVLLNAHNGEPLASPKLYNEPQSAQAVSRAAVWPLLLMNDTLSVLPVICPNRSQSTVGHTATQLSLRVLPEPMGFKSVVVSCYAKIMECGF
jgi:hypothetical protein